MDDCETSHPTVTQVEGFGTFDIVKRLRPLIVAVGRPAVAEPDLVEQEYVGDYRPCTAKPMLAAGNRHF